MSEKAKEAIEAIVKEAETDPVKMAFLAVLNAGSKLNKITADKETAGNAETQ